MSKLIFNIGYIGDGIYKSRINGVITREYATWWSMLQRCYDEKYKEKHNTYEDCYTVEEWHNFQNFAKWYSDNYYQIGEERMCLDKDILIKGNKVYSPDTCIFVPQNINLLFTKNDNRRNGLPIGVSFDKSRNKYIAMCGNNSGKRINLGRFNTIDEAFNVYKSFKEKVVKDIAEEHKNTIPRNLYNAMLNYTVEAID